MVQTTLHVGLGGIVEELIVAGIVELMSLGHRTEEKELGIKPFF